MQFKEMCVVVILCYIVSDWQVLGTVEDQKDDWIHPTNSFESNTLQKIALTDEFCMCDAGDIPEVSSNKAALSIFKKFVRQLFSREKLQFDKQLSLFQRELFFTIHPAQLEKLEQLEDPRDMDIILTDIFKNARTTNKYSNNSSWSSISELIWDILKDFFLLLRFSEVRFATIVLLAILIGWFIHRKYKIGIIVTIIGGILIFGYFVTYLECNRELEIKQMLDVIERQEAAQPSEPRWYTPFTSWFSSSNTDTIRTSKQQYVKKQSKLDLTFCRPDHVLMLYVNDLFLKQLEFLIEKVTSTLGTLKNTLTFPYNYIAAIGLIFMICFVTKLTFEHILSPRVWSGFFQRRGRDPADSRNSQEALPYHEDRLTGENLKLFLKALGTPNILVNNANFPTVSCVQEVQEPLDPQILQGDASSSSNNNSKDTSVSKSIASSLNSSTNSNVSMETAASQLETMKISKNNSDPSFVLISQVTLEDIPND